MKILALFTICFTPFFLLKTAAAAEQKAEIHISVADSEILQGEAVPEFKAEISAEGRADLVLDEGSGYTIGDLEKELNAEGAYTLQSSGDGSTEGEYPIVFSLQEELKDKLSRYHKRVTVE